jgi:hypothetical protein
MKPKFTLAVASILLTLTSCHRYYTSSSFEEKTAKHKIVAVLPPQIVMTGQQSRRLSNEDILAMEEKESKMFQESLYNNILRQSGKSNKVMDVSLQPYSNTLSLLAQNNISVRESWTKDDNELAQILGVDAVVRSSIQKDRYMSDEASLGITVARNIILTASKAPVIMPVSNKTSDIHATCTLISKGETLWNDYYKEESNWNNPANDIIEHITMKFARHFPYNKKA